MLQPPPGTYSPSDPSFPDPLPPFVTQNAEAELPKPEPKEVRLVTVEPVSLKFLLNDAVSSKVSLTVTNLTRKRVAWRLRSNAPTRYVVNPACGFITAGEMVKLSVELTNTNKYSARHKFIVQAMEARDEEKDRRKVWDTERAQQLENLQCVRIYTTSNNQDSAKGSPTRKMPAFSQDLSNANPEEKIAELTQQAKVFIEEKEKASKKMVSAINEVKRVEVDLDRVGIQCKELNAQVNTITAQITALEERSAELEQQIKSMLSRG